MTTQHLVSALGWGTAINLAIYAMAAIMIVFLRDWMSAKNKRSLTGK